MPRNTAIPVPATSTVLRLNDGLPTIVADPWVIERDATRCRDSLAQCNAQIIVPFTALSTFDVTLRRQVRAVWISPDDDIETFPWLDDLDLIAIDFPTFRDGRCYSLGHLLRIRYKWKGELRAIGDVQKSQLHYLRRSGFDTLVLRDDRGI